MEGQWWQRAGTVAAAAAPASQQLCGKPAEKREGIQALHLQRQAGGGSSHSSSVRQGGSTQAARGAPNVHGPLWLRWSSQQRNNSPNAHNTSSAGQPCAQSQQPCAQRQQQGPAVQQQACRGCHGQPQPLVPTAAQRHLLPAVQALHICPVAKVLRCKMEAPAQDSRVQLRQAISGAAGDSWHVTASRRGEHVAAAAVGCSVRAADAAANSMSAANRCNRFCLAATSVHVPRHAAAARRRCRAAAAPPSGCRAPIFFQFLAPCCCTRRRSRSSCRGGGGQRSAATQGGVAPHGRGHAGGVAAVDSCSPCAKLRARGTHLLLGPASPAVPPHFGLHPAAAEGGTGRGCQRAGEPLPQRWP